VRFEDFWYVVARSDELGPKPLARTILGEWLVVFRDATGAARALRDRCMHRAGRLSDGVVRDGCLRCPYHGWTYDGAGALVEVPAEGGDFAQKFDRRAQAFTTAEVDDYVYVRLSDDADAEPAPWRLPAHGAPGYRTVRLVNRFENNVTNCAENFIDIPHTVFVHPGIFRTPRRQRIEATVTRQAGRVEATYRGETDNLGWFRWFLNPDGRPIEHVDRFILPNITSVEYRFGPRRHFFITSQSVPVGPEETLVYTDLTFDYGWFNTLAAPIVRWQGQAVIDQDIVALRRQMEVIRRYGDGFANSPCDIIHVFVESIREAIAQGKNPRALPDRSRDVVFWV
jgi:phenylpropionate dioxygenase-like ring-hydroxylating dioxygenase large terminal subunit